MFPLSTKTFPTTADELTTLLNDGFGRLFLGASNPVSLRDKAYPDLEELRISLDGATLRPDAPKPPALRGGDAPGIRADRFHLNAEGVSIGPGTANLRLSARDVSLHQARTAEDEIVLVLRNAREGRVEINVASDQLERIIAELAKQEAAKQGVTIESVQLTLRERGPRNLSAEIRLHARKMFFKTVIRIAADLDLDDQLNATISGLTCQGEGAIGSLACGFLAPQLQKIDGRSLSLLALPLGEVRLRDVRLSAGDKLVVNAEFGT